MNHAEQLQIQKTAKVKSDELARIATVYVEKGLGGKNFDAIPYDESVSLRAPLNQGGSQIPVTGKENLRNTWWAPLPDLVGEVKVLGVYPNVEESSVAVEFHCEILNPSCWLRIIDRFKINDEGKIYDQENFFDPSPLTAGK